MKLGDYMERNGLDDDTMADKVRTADVACDRTKINRYRRGKRRPDWPVIERIDKITKGAVSANDWMHLEAAQ